MTGQVMSQSGKAWKNINYSMKRWKAGQPMSSLPYIKDPNGGDVVTETLVSRILFADIVQGQDLTVYGVEFIHNDQVHVIRASKEVILCAGAIKDPQILELSGIGCPNILSKIGIDIKLELPGVGENVQDRPHVPVTFELDSKASYETPDMTADPDYIQKVMKL